ncbi:MAG: hypothetical protein ACREPR_12790 [Brasilonema sp.]
MQITDATLDHRLISQLFPTSTVKKLLHFLWIEDQMIVSSSYHVQQRFT